MDFTTRPLGEASVLVTGGTGLIGRQVVRLLILMGARVKVVSLDQVTLDDKVDLVRGDLTDFDFCMEQMIGVDSVFHLAGVKGSLQVTKSNPASFFVPLMMMNTNVLEAARKQDVKTLVYTSSIGAYASADDFHESQGMDGVPQDEFPGWAKRMAELQIQAYRHQYGTDWAVVRPCNVYGPGDNFDPRNAMVIPSLMARIRGGEKPLRVWGDGNAVRDFAFSADVAAGVVQAALHGTRGEFVNLGSGMGYSIRQLVETLASFIDFEYEFDASKPSGAPRRVMDISRAREWLDYEPRTSLYDGLKQTWEWYLANSNESAHKHNYFV